MSTFNLILLVIVGLSLFSSLLIVAVCVASSRSHRLTMRSSARQSTDQVNHLMASDLRKLQNSHLNGHNTIATSH